MSFDHSFNDPRHLVDFDLRNIDYLIRQFDPKLVDKAFNRTLNRMQTKVSTFIAKDVSGYYNVSSARVKKDLSIKKVVSGYGTHERPSRILVWAGLRIGLTQFKGTVRNVKVQATSKRGKRFRTTRKAAYAKTIRRGERKRAKHKDGRFGFPAHGMVGYNPAGPRENYHFFVRKKDSKDVEVALYGKSVPQMITDKTLNKTADMLHEAMPVEFNRNIEYFLGKQVGLY